MGDTVGIISPAGALFEKTSLEEFKKILQGFGFIVREGKHLHKRIGYFAGTDEERAEDVMTMFKDPDVKGIFCAKGGWGCARILPLLDYALIKKNPKVLIGFSDISSLLNAIAKEAMLVTFHGPVGNSGWNEFSSSSFINTVMDKKPMEYSFGENETICSEGLAKGNLVGGNLSIICASIGTPYAPAFQGFQKRVLFLEETTEEPYRIDRMLTQLKQSGAFDALQAILFGQCTKCIAEEPDKAFTIQEVFAQHFKGLKIPVVTGLPFGHTKDKLTMPVGGAVSIDTQNKKLIIYPGVQ